MALYGSTPAQGTGSTQPVSTKRRLKRPSPSPVFAPGKGVGEAPGKPVPPKNIGDILGPLQPRQKSPAPSNPFPTTKPSNALYDMRKRRKMIMDRIKANKKRMKQSFIGGM